MGNIVSAPLATKDINRHLRAESGYVSFDVEMAKLALKENGMSIAKLTSEHGSKHIINDGFRNGIIAANVWEDITEQVHDITVAYKAFSYNKGELEGRTHEETPITVHFDRERARHILDTMGLTMTRLHQKSCLDISVKTFKNEFYMGHMPLENFKRILEIAPKLADTVLNQEACGIEPYSLMKAELPDDVKALDEALNTVFDAPKKEESQNIADRFKMFIHLFEEFGGKTIHVVDDKAKIDNRIVTKDFLCAQRWFNSSHAIPTLYDLYNDGFGWHMPEIAKFIVLKSYSMDIANNGEDIEVHINWEV